MYLLATNVVSELRRPKPHPAVVKWVTETSPDAIFLSAVTVGEIQSGIEITREQDPTKADELDAWLARLISSHEVLPMDAALFREWGRIKHRQSNTLLVDAMIAATARGHGLTVATRNVSDFRALGVEVLDPFGAG